MTNPKFGSLQVFYTYPGGDDASVELLTNIQATRQFHVGPESLVAVSIEVSSYQDDVGEPWFIRVQTKLSDVVIDQSDFPTYSDVVIDSAIRIFFFDQFVSVSLNDKWIYSYGFASVSYTGDTTASLKLDGSTTTITDIRRVELSDGREAVFVDYESTTDNAIQSIIQQRPILVLPHVNRKLTFTYVAEKDTIDASFVNSYTEKTSHPSSLSSDGLVYFEDVGVSIDLETARDVGFITKLYRLSELNTGATAAAGTLQRQARQRRVMVDVVQRLDPRIEVADVLHIDLFTSSTERHIERDIIVEDVRISVRDGDYSMAVTGRRKA